MTAGKKQFGQDIGVLQVLRTTIGAEIEHLKNTVVNIDQDGLKFPGSTKDAIREFDAFVALKKQLQKVPHPR